MMDGNYMEELGGGKYGMYNKAKELLREYSGSEIEVEERIYKGVELESGTTGNKSEEIAGDRGPEEAASLKEVEELRTGQQYKSLPEAEIGDASISSDIAAGTLPTEATGITAMSGAGLTLLGGAAVAGVAIGTGIDYLMGWPSLPSILGGGEVALPKTFYYSEWLPKIKVSAIVECKSMTNELPEAAQKEKCGHAGEQAKEKVVYYSTEKKEYTEEKLAGEGITYQSEWSGFSTTYRNCHSSTWLKCQETYVGEAEYSGEKLKTYSDHFYFVAPTGKETPTGITPYSPGPVWDAYPAKELYKDRTGVEQPEKAPEVSPMTKLTSPKKTAIATQEGPLAYNIIYTNPALIPGKGTHELPSPSEIEIPAVQSNELATTYKSELESLGFTEVTVQTLPEDDTDTELGPGAATSVAPAAGTQALPSTDITVEANPDTAGPAEPTKGIGGPTLPGIKLPSFGVLCKGFPFGVPCWLVQGIESWSSSAVAPEWGVENLEIDGHKITGKFKLAELEPIMEKVRPAMVIFATFGLVLLFYGFAKGGGPPSGGKGDADSGDTFDYDDNEYRTDV
jgi:hypothetical protein